MPLKKISNILWGPPKKFSTDFEERKVSWLELFYDLVYVIAISKITHHLAAHFSVSGLLDYIYFFIMIYWGWLNGSLYHDLHGSPGLRTRLMTLWQMLIVAALVITIDSDPENLLFNATIAVMIMQFYITYMWWSVGIYDKDHRRLNKPYTMIYLLSLALMFATLFVAQPYIRILFYATLFLNYIPPFVTQNLYLRKESLELNLSTSMSERLGLFTIIVFGEVVLGVVNGVIELHHLDWMIWLNFGMAIGIVFSIWWVFFTLVSDRQCKKGFTNSSLLEILYIPTLMALGLMSVSFADLFQSFLHNGEHLSIIKMTFGYALSLFLLGINLMLFLLEYPEDLITFKKKIQKVITATLLVLLVFTTLNLAVSLCVFLIVILGIVIAMILVFNRIWFDHKEAYSAKYKTLNSERLS